MRYAFLAGLAVVVLLIPVNRWLATKIEGASERMMAHKDARLQVMGELLRGIHQVKLSAWEPRFIRKVTPSDGQSSPATTFRHNVLGKCRIWLQVCPALICSPECRIGILLAQPYPSRCTCFNHQLDIAPSSI